MLVSSTNNTARLTEMRCWKVVIALGVVRLIQKLVGLSGSRHLKSPGKRQIKNSVVLIVFLCSYNQ